MDLLAGKPGVVQPEPEPGDPMGSEKSLMFLGFLSRFALWLTGVLQVRALFFTVTGANTVAEGVEPIFLGMVSDIPYIVGAFVIALLLIWPPIVTLFR